MSYYMIIVGEPHYNEINNKLRFMPAYEAQEYISELAIELEELDGKPLFLVEDGYTGTSDEIIMDAKYLLWEDKNIDNTILADLLKHCFANGISFRIWLEDNEKDAHKKNSTEVTSYDETLSVLANKSGAWWHSP